MQLLAGHGGIGLYFAFLAIKGSPLFVPKKPKKIVDAALSKWLLRGVASDINPPLSAAKSEAESGLEAISSCSCFRIDSTV
jgi:hypothetical protein